MRAVSRLARLVVMAFAAMALAASSASATTPVSVIKGDGTACPAAGCLVHQEGEVRIFFHFFGVESTEAVCHVEWRAHAFPNGTGVVDSQTLTPGAHDADCSNGLYPGCSMPWAYAVEDDPGVRTAHFDVCVSPAENASDCVGEYITTVTESGSAAPGAETQTQTATDLRIGASSFCELTITLTSEVAAGQGDSIHLRP